MGNKNQAKICVFIGFLVCVCLFFEGATAQQGQQLPTAHILKDCTPLKETAQQCRVGVAFDLPPGWSIYAPGTTGDHEEGVPHALFEGQRLDFLWPPATLVHLGGQDVGVYDHHATLPLAQPLIVPKGAQSLFSVNYVGCFKSQCHFFEQKWDLSQSISQENEANILNQAQKRATPTPKFIEPRQEGTFSLLWLFMLSFLGGIILNFMPCVLPVLSLKIVGLLKKKNEEGAGNNSFLRWRFGMVFLGIWTFFLLFAGTSLTLRMAGILLGWGAHFQSPLVLGILTIIMILMGLNLWDVVQWRMPDFLTNWLSKWQLPSRGSSMSETKKTLWKDYLSGVLTAIMATPCTAPFLGTALGVSLTQDPLWTAPLLMMVGVGLGFPYLFAICFPGFLAYLPSPGAWMITLKRFLSLGFFMTGLWLGSLLLPGDIFEESSSPNKVATDTKISWSPFSQQKLSKARAQGKRVLVDITASWCLSCKVNKLIAYGNKRVQKMLASPELVKLQGNWTHADPEIEAYLKTQGRAGIPLTVYYSDQFPHGKTLPEILSPTDLLSVLGGV